MTEESLPVLVSGLKARGADVWAKSIQCDLFFYLLFVFCVFTQDIRLKRSEERERPCSESVCTGTAPFAHRWDSNGNSNKT